MNRSINIRTYVVAVIIGLISSMMLVGCGNNNTEVVEVKHEDTANEQAITEKDQAIDLSEEESEDTAVEDDSANDEINMVQHYVMAEKYNIDGDLIEISYFEEGKETKEEKFSNGCLLYSYEYTYDLSDNLIKIEQINENTTLNKWEYKYDDLNNMISSVAYNKNGQIIDESFYTYEYDNNNNIIMKTQTIKSKNSELEYSVFYEYNEDNSLLCATDIYGAKEEYIYAPNGNLLVKSIFDADGEIASEENYYYDDDQKLVRMNDYEQDELKSYIIYKF